MRKFILRAIYGCCETAASLSLMVLYYRSEPSLRARCADFREQHPRKAAHDVDEKSENQYGVVE